MTRTSLASLPLVLLLTLSTGTGWTGPVEDGEEALRQGNHSLALRFFKVAIQADPENERAWSGYQAASKAAARDSSPGRPPRRTLPRTQAPAGVPVAQPVAQEVPDEPTAPVSDRRLPDQDIATRYLKGEPLFYSKAIEDMVQRRLKKKLRVQQAIYDQEKETLTREYVRKRGGSLGMQATLFTPQLYGHLARLRAHKNKLGPAGAKELWLKEADKSFRTLEFYVVIKNLTYEGGIQSRRRRIDITDIEKKIFLEDDRGLRYEPYKTTPPKTDLIKDMDEMTVWFAPISQKGTPIWEGAVSEVRLVIEDVEGEAHRIVFPFPKSTFRRMVQLGSR